jgi:molybdate transport system substrate-binding protein
LGDAFRAVAEAYQQDGGAEVVFNFAASQQLANALREGAPADVFASANPRQMEAAVQASRVAADDVAVFASSRLVIVVSADSAIDIANPRDLTSAGLRLVLAAQEVPAGQYALEFLAKASKDTAYGAGYARAVLGRVVSYEENVRAVLNKVDLGEADAGIVYASDLAGPVGARVRRVDIPDALNVQVVYPIAAVQDSPHQQEARAFVDFVRSAAGQRILAEYGFLPVP